MESNLWRSSCLTAILIILLPGNVRSETLFDILLDERDHCTSARAPGACTPEVVREKVAWACEQLKQRGKDALPELRIMRFSCCGEPNYIWINDTRPTMILHPVKSTLNGKDLSDSVDGKGRRIFVEFTKAANLSPEGSWVSYVWAKTGESKATPKRSWIRKCPVKGSDEAWIVGSGMWE